MEYCGFEKPKSIFKLQQHPTKIWKMPLHATPNTIQQHIEEKSRCVMKRKERKGETFADFALAQI